MSLDLQQTIALVYLHHMGFVDTKVLLEEVCSLSGLSRKVLTPDAQKLLPDIPSTGHVPDIDL